MTDIILPLNDGSRYDNMELRYCLRSIEKHLKGINRIIIIGEKPAFINWDNVIHISCEDNPDNKQRAHNIYRKIVAGIQSVYDLSDNFLFVNDDHFLLNDFEASEFPYLHRGILQLHRVPGEANLRQMTNTFEVAAYKPVLDFSVHCPIIYNKNNFISAFKHFYVWPEYGYEIKSLYFNHTYPPDTIQIINISECEDLKFSQPLMKSTIYNVLEGREWFSTGDICLREGGMKEVLQELYNHKSKYEL